MRTERAFTLVEILVVIVIIGILVSLVAVAVSGAMRVAKRGAIAMEMSQIAMALERYKAEFGEYPPDMFDDEALVRHVKKRWPRLDLAEHSGVMPDDSPEVAIRKQSEWIKDVISVTYSTRYPCSNCGITCDRYDRDNDDCDCRNNHICTCNPCIVNFRQVNAPVGALALWLGGFPNTDGKLSGFFADPENPFCTDVPLADWVFDKKVFIDLELEGRRGDEGKRVRLVNYWGDCGVPIIGNEIRNDFVPIVYFRGSADGGHKAYMITDESHAKFGEVKQFDFRSTDLGFCVPYAEEVNGGVIKWKNSTTFQLIHPGLDGKFGEPALADPTVAPLRIIKSGDIGPQDLDNLTNFSDYKELKSILP